FSLNTRKRPPKGDLFRQAVGRITDAAIFPIYLHYITPFGTEQAACYAVKKSRPKYKRPGYILR
ncbi:hypothetical protein, partial [Ruthenibacterium lactatiformans]